MKLTSKFASGIAAFGLALGFAGPAQAGYQVLDGWSFTSSKTNVSDIGRLNLVSGSATVEQQINGSGNAFIGARFAEYGAIFSLSYTPENTVGAGDVGDPVLLGQMFTIKFTDVSGIVTELVDAGFRYVFQSGKVSISNGTDTASGAIIGIGGTASQTAVIGGFNGDSTLLASIAEVFGFNFFNSDGDSLLSDMASGKVLFQAVTNNNVTGKGTTGACSFDATATCATLKVASAGDAYLVQQVPEPASVALLGVGLLGIGALRRRQRS